MKRLAAPAVLVLGFLSVLSVPAQQIHRNGFETRQPTWSRQNADAQFRELAHEMTDATAHTGQLSEHIHIQAEQGSFVHYAYPVGRAPLNDELSVSLWVKANRPGVQLLARLVLPRERNPKNLDEPLTTLLRGDVYRQVSRWERLELRRPVKLAKEQQQLMRAELKRDVDFTDAYLDRLLLNVYGGQGVTEAWIDDLELGPVLDNAPFLATSRPVDAPKTLTPDRLPSTPRPRGAALVELNQDQLLVNSKRFFIRGIRHSDTPLKVLRDAGFNALWLEHTATPALLEEATQAGFWLVPSVPVASDDPSVTTSAGLGRVVQRFLEKDAVLFWYLGGGLAEEQAPRVEAAAKLIRSADPQRPLGANAWDGFRAYGRSLDLLGMHRWPLLTGLELAQYRDWLNQRRLLARPDAFLWTWVQTHLPDWYTALVYDRPSTAGFDEPVGPQPEQIRLLTYIALAAGARGLGFWSDRFLADSHQGRDRLLTLALLNLELRLLEPFLVAAGSPTWIDTSIPEVKAAVLRSDRGVLVLPMWLGKGSQFVPGQSAVTTLNLTVPQVPVGTQAWLVSPGEVRSLRIGRVVGGTPIAIPDFSLTAAVVFTSDNSLVERFQDVIRQTQKLATQWAYDLATVEIDKVTRVYAELERAGHPLRDGPSLLQDAQRRLRLCYDRANAGDYREAYAEANRALRPVRILMRAQWEEAVKAVNNVPVSSPYAVSYFTLPRHWRFVEFVRRGSVGPNALPEGGFEQDAAVTQATWAPQEATLDAVTLTARRVSDEPREGKQCLMLQIKPQNPQLPPRALERTYLAIASPKVRLQPGSLVRITGWVRIPEPITASVDGVLLYDDAGGEPLALRLTEKMAWTQFTLYRHVPASGTLQVTAALTGLGTVYFDDLRIEPLLESAAVSEARRASKGE